LRLLPHNILDDHPGDKRVVMGLLDRFRAQPRWKNGNPAIRLAAVEDMPLDQQDTIVSIAREDRDANVRTAALRKVIDPAAIAAIGRADADARVRDEASSLLVDLAKGEFEGTSQAESLTALAGLSDAKHLLIVAREATNDVVARTALGRLSDEVSISSVARKATVAAVRLEALARLTSAGDIAAVAVRSEFKDVTLAAVERLADRAVLDDIANRAKNKTAAKRARTMVRAIDAEAEAAAARAAAAAAVVDPAVEEQRRRQRTAESLCGRLAVIAAGAQEEDEAALAEVERAWNALGDLGDAELLAKYEAAHTAAEQVIATRGEERAERARMLQANAEAIAARRALCEQADTIGGDETPAKIADVRAAWEVLPVLPDAAEAARWESRFQASCRSAETRHRTLTQARANQEKAERVCAELERLAGSATADIDAMADAGTEGGGQSRGPRPSPVVALRREWQHLAAAGVDDAALAARFAAVDAQLRQQEADARERRAKRQQENLTRLNALCEELDGLVKSEALNLRQAERALRDARAGIDAPGPLPTRQDADAVAERLTGLMGGLFPRVQELRDLDEWQRWANAGVQEELCVRVEGLMAVEDLAAAAKQLRETQAQWKQVASAPREQSQVLWTRFKAASDAVRARCDVYYAQLAEEQTANRAKKEALCERAEALSSSVDWIKTADAIKALQVEWKGIGTAPRADEKQLWDRFHKACDTFFTRRREDLQQRKETWTANLARKEAICEQAEAIAQTTEWQKGIEEIKKLQAEWKTIGAVKKTRSEEVWQRFRTACDTFFERYQQREHTAAASAASAVEAACAELEQMIPETVVEPSAAPDGLTEKVAATRKLVAETLPSLSRERGIRAADRLNHVLSRIVGIWPASFAETDLDPDANIHKLEALCVQVEKLLVGAGLEPGNVEEDAAATAQGAEPETPATLLARQLREALATNTIAGRQDDTAKWKAVSDQVRTAQAAWKRVAPVPEASGRSLHARFQRACARVAEKMEQRQRA
jgi:hypothetical protein